MDILLETISLVLDEMEQPETSTQAREALLTAYEQLMKTASASLRQERTAWLIIKPKLSLPHKSGFTAEEKTILADLAAEEDARKEWHFRVPQE